MRESFEMRFHIVLWKWYQKNAMECYRPEHVNAMVEMLKPNLKGLRWRIICITDDANKIDRCETFPLWRDCGELSNATKASLPSCYRRLKLYDPETQAKLGIKEGERIISLDLDSVICNSLVPTLSRPDRFVGWGLPGTYHPKVFNGSFQMFTAGDLAEIWKEFDPATSPAEAFAAKYLGSDQSWISYRLVNKPGCIGVEYPEFASYPNHVRKLAHFRSDTAIVFFHGRRKPWHHVSMQESPWINRYWRNPDVHQDQAIQSG